MFFFFFNIRTMNKSQTTTSTTTMKSTNSVGSGSSQRKKNRPWNGPHFRASKTAGCHHCGLPRGNDKNQEGFRVAAGSPLERLEEVAQVGKKLLRDKSI